MRIIFATLFMVACAAFASEADFNGRWDITVEGATRAWWLEVQGAGTSAPRARFVSAYAGDLNQADEVSIRNGELGCVFIHKPRGGNATEPVGKTILRARLKAGYLVGTAETAGQPTIVWKGMRAPEIADRDDGSWVEAGPVRLFNGRNLDGWEPIEKDRPLKWRASGGILEVAESGPNANLATRAKFWNFRLHTECRLPTGGNSGIGLRGRYEVQVIDDYGRPPDAHSNGSLYSRIAPSLNASLPAGAWQSYDITLIGRELTVVLNGKKIIDRGWVEGLTAMAHDPYEGEPGPISLQGDHGPVAYRNIVLTPLVKRK